MIARLTRQFSRRALTAPNLTYYLWRFVANGGRTCRAALARPAHDDARAIGGELTRSGISIGPSDRFLATDGRLALQDAAARVLATGRSPDVEAVVTGGAPEDGRPKDFLVHLVAYPGGIPPEDPLLKVALDRKLLEIVASYLGMWPSLYSVDAWLNYPTDAPPQVSQLWHRDPEDLRLVKAFIYLVDVDEQCGPFTYIPRTHPFGDETVAAQRLEKKKRMTDDRMHRVFPPESWKVCTGAANTMILADTVGYHRGGKPVAGRRILITFTYTSGTPITERPVRLTGRPRWLSSGIQRLAVAPLLRPARVAVPVKKKRR